MVSAQRFKDAMARLGAAVNVVTTAGPAGTCGFTASAVCSVSAEPPTLLVCMNKTSAQGAAFRKNNVLCVNALSAAQEDLSNVFAGLTREEMDARFAHAEWTVLQTGAPVLCDAAVSFDCRVEKIVHAGSHRVFFCRVLAVSLGDAPHALMYFRRAYHAVGETASL